ncbi:MAG: hypothetical protein PHU12_02605 [Candidatus Aenigmarchaeota archaeon]|nr:hypothetical protein [Candidatus Aenigmarchaeota archaeon]
MELIKEPIEIGMDCAIIADALVRCGGAELIKTEDRYTLNECEKIVMEILCADCDKEFEELDMKFKKMNKQRDIHIKKNIENTLKENENGILFIGADHDIILNEINVIYLYDKKQLAEETNSLINELGL